MSTGAYCLVACADLGASAAPSWWYWPTCASGPPVPGLTGPAALLLAHAGSRWPMDNAVRVSLRSPRGMPSGTVASFGSAWSLPCPLGLVWDLLGLLTVILASSTVMAHTRATLPHAWPESHGLCRMVTRFPVLSHAGLYVKARCGPIWGYVCLLEPILGCVCIAGHVDMHPP